MEYELFMDYFIVLEVISGIGLPLAQYRENVYNLYEIKTPNRKTPLIQSYR